MKREARYIEIGKYHPLWLQSLWNMQPSNTKCCATARDGNKCDIINIWKFSIRQYFFFLFINQIQGLPSFQSICYSLGLVKLPVIHFHYRSKVKLSLLILWRHIDKGEVWIPLSRTLVLGGDELSTTCPGHCTPGKNPSTHWAMEQHNKRSCLPIFLPETGAEVKNEDASNTWIHGTRHWTWKNQILPVQV